MIALQYDDGGVTRALELGIDSLSDLGPIFREYLAWLRPDVDKVFKNNNWKPLEDETIAKNQGQLQAKIDKINQFRYQGLSRKLAGEQRRAYRGYLRAGARGVEASKLARKQRTVERHAAVREAFESLRQGGTAGAKETKRLLPRMARRDVLAEAKIEAVKNGQLLGNIAYSLKGNIGKDYLEYFSLIPWAGVHNEGLPAGKGAQEPERRFLEWNPERIAKLAEIAANHVAKKIKKGA